MTAAGGAGGTAAGSGVACRAWCRLDLAGGTLDIWPLGLVFPGAATVNVAIDLPVDVELAPADGYRVDLGTEPLVAASASALRALPAAALVGLVLEELAMPPVAVRVRSGSPIGAGLGASSALTVALIAAGRRFLGLPELEPRELVRSCRDLEARLMELPTGVQDHYPAVMGGALHLRYGIGGETVTRLPVDLDELGEHLVVAYTGQSHFSAATNWQIIRRCLERHPETRRALRDIADVAAALAPAVAGGDWARVGALVGAEWEARRRLADEVTTPRIEMLLGVARDHGAWGGKACGAGGGGSIVVVAPRGRRGPVAAALEKAGARILPVRPTAAGLAVDTRAA